MTRKAVYWASTAILVMELAAGAYLDLSRNPYVVGIVRSLGYPVYVLTIVGIWKVLAVAALLWPRLSRLKEWAYAGVFFEMIGAAESHLLAHDAGQITVPLVFAGVALVSWWFQPREKKSW